MDHATYFKEVVAAYQAEVRGEATFSTLAERTEDPDELEIWTTLTRLEATTRERLTPLLRRHGLDTTPDPDQRRLGRERGEARAIAGFAATIRSMSQSIPPFVTLYGRLELEGPASDQVELAFLNAHEKALFEFSIRALAGDGRESLAPIRALLEK